jgi:hypothetical protein
MHLVTVDPSGSITESDRLKVDSIDGMPTHFVQLGLAQLLTLEDWNLITRA